MSARPGSVLARSPPWPWRRPRRRLRGPRRVQGLGLQRIRSHKIAVIDAQSGQLSSLGKWEYKGAKLAVDEWNRAGGIGVRTSLGRRMRAMRDDPLAAGAVGAQIPLLRMTAFLLASVYGGVAGVLYAGLVRFVAPDTFSIANTFLLLAMVVIGGRQSLVGCVIGAVGLSLIREVGKRFRGCGPWTGCR
ncbi:hypothetical protein OG417_32175 [Actinoallomurus sp. NBC_01490]|uniref:branched-chain amino acid ABC transporter permease n=1 Tax=Actinoallomurus sp. NBC_01490 TaxID=2903557 RepID=UPI002E381779|nr:hypothetical protein [Actinoallomurus sp. NBC_01490]